MADSATMTRSDRMLAGVERVGNKLPDPFMLFLGLFLFVGVVSTGLQLAGTSVTIPGTDEAVLHGRTGLLVPPADPQALAGAISAVLSDPTLARRLGEAGRERVRQHFSAERMVERVMGVYEELLAAKHRFGRG